MTPEEKWDRLSNPKTLEDYGLCLSEEELGTFEEGRKILVGARLAAGRNQDRYSEAAKSMGAQASKTLDDVAQRIIRWTKP